MRLSTWSDYELLDASSLERLERWKDIILIRPDPQIIWKTEKTNPLWKKASARYIRSKSGGGAWQVYKKIPDVWQISYKNINFRIKPMGFKHTGVFPEQAVNWDYASNKIKNAGREISVLNLFAYTGGATLACAQAGAKVCHVDASKGMVQWARENAKASNMENLPIRWIVDDCLKFVKREIRRGNKYDAIIMDPPSYGRGPNGEVWKLEEQLYDFLLEVSALLSDEPLFLILNSYTAGLSAGVMEYLLSCVLLSQYPGYKVTSDEIGLKATQTGMVLPCGSSAIFEKI